MSEREVEAIHIFDRLLDGEYPVKCNACDQITRTSLVHRKDYCPKCGRPLTKSSVTEVSSVEYKASRKGE